MKLLWPGCLVLGCCLFVAGIVSSQEKMLELSEFQSETGQFRILFPEKPTLKTKNIENLKQHLYQSTYRLTMFSVSHTELPKESEKVPAKILHDLYQKGEVDEGGKLLSSKDITFGKFSGREFVIGTKSADGSGRIRTVRHYIVGTISYAIAIDQGDQSVSKEIVDRYFKSFELNALPRKGAAMRQCDGHIGPHGRVIRPDARGCAGMRVDARQPRRNIAAINRVQHGAVNACGRPLTVAHGSHERKQPRLHLRAESHVAFSWSRPHDRRSRQSDPRL